MDQMMIKHYIQGIRNNGANDWKPAEYLLIELTGKTEWTGSQCKSFGRSIFEHYIENSEDLELILAVSGFLNDKYKYLSTASERREEYINNLSKDNRDRKYKNAYPSSLRRSTENKIINKIVSRIQEDMEEGKTSELIKKWAYNNENADTTNFPLGESVKTDTDDTTNDEISEKSSVNEKGRTNETDIDSRAENSTNKETLSNVGDGFSTDKGCNNYKVEYHFSPFLLNLKFVGIVVIPILAVIGFCLYLELIPASTPDTASVSDTASTPSITEIFVSADDIELEVGECCGLAVCFLPIEANKSDLCYDTSDPNVATVSNNGVVLAQGNWDGDGIRTVNIQIWTESGASTTKSITVRKSEASRIPSTIDVDDVIFSYTLEMSVRPVGGTKADWTDSLAVKIGDEVEYQIAYRNTSGVDQRDVMIKDTLPSNLEYIPGSTRLWSATIDGEVVDDTILTTAINIGHYAPNANAYVRFRAKVVDQNLVCGRNILVNWVKGTVNDEVLQDFANVIVYDE